MAALTIEELDTEISRAKAEIKDLDAKYQGEQMPEEARQQWNEINEAHDGLVETRKELVARQERVAKLYGQDDAVEKEPTRANITSTRKRVPDDPTDLSAYRSLSNSMDDLERAYRDGAMKIVERMRPAIDFADVERSQDRIAEILDGADRQIGADGAPHSFARRVINTSSPAYERAFAKYAAGGRDALNPDEIRALSLTNTAGGYAVPVTLDPTVILTSAGRICPVRDVCKVITITGNTWNGISSTGVTASYAAESTEASDGAPTLVQPTANVEKAQVFIPFTIEIGQDWGSMGAEMSRLIGEAKEDLESVQFLTGLGHASSAPQGLIAVGGATAVVTSAATATFAVADLYSLENALQVRSRVRGVFFGSKAAYQKIRQFDTAGGANLWTQLQFGNPADLIGYPAYEWSAYSSAITTSGSTILTFGDPSRFQVVDRVGMDVEYIPHLFATANNRPYGARGLYAYWRNTSSVLTPGLSANSAFQSLKLL